MSPTVDVLRVGHRVARDARVTTHVGLVARAFGARRLLLCPPDSGVERSISGVARRFGPALEVEGTREWRKAIRSFPGKVVHLTMYGEPLSKVAPELSAESALLVVVGAEKVEGDLYGMADWNVAVGNQPHSEVAALAVFLYEVLGPAVLSRDLGGPFRIEPQARGKRVVRTEDGLPERQGSR
ncbi:MAG: tRNA (cytidine(56)-2'-O)-methyltransferase [Methanobacteriota archaeon]